MQQHGTDCQGSVCRIRDTQAKNPPRLHSTKCIELHVIKLLEAKKGFALLPRSWVVERSFRWFNRFRRLARDYEQLPETLADFHFVVFSVLMPAHFAALHKSA